MKKRILSAILVLSFIFSCFSITPMAASTYNHTTNVPLIDSYTSAELGGVLTRTIEGTKIVITWEPFSNNGDAYTLVREENNIFFDGALMADENNAFAIKEFARARISSVKWGAWQTFSERVNTGGMPVVVVAGVIAAVAPGITVRAIAAAIAGIASSEYYTVSGRMRYGTDSKYDYYERYTSIQTDTGTYLIRDSFDQGKKPIR